MRTFLHTFTEMVKLIPVMSRRARPETVEALLTSPDVFAQAGITTRKRLNHFFAQMAHESAGFSAHVERRSASSAERKYGRHTRVGKILGNVRSGDGARYVGRGIIQLTGRWNYKFYGKKIGVDLENNPDLAAEPLNAVKIAVAYWEQRNLNILADQGNIRRITKKINGGYNGLHDRKRWLRRFEKLSLPPFVPKAPKRAEKAASSESSPPQSAPNVPQKAPEELSQASYMAALGEALRKAYEAFLEAMRASKKPPPK